MSLPLFLMLLIGCCAYALWRGGGPERWAAGLQLGAFALDEALRRWIERDAYTTVAVASFALDLVLLVALFVLADRSTRWWPVWLFGWQLAAIVAHVAKTIDPGMTRTGYALQTAIWAYPMLIAMAIGAARHHRRVTAGIVRPAWKSMLR